MRKRTNSQATENLLKNHNLCGVLGPNRLGTTFCGQNNWHENDKFSHNKVGDPQLHVFNLAIFERHVYMDVFNLNHLGSSNKLIHVMDVMPIIVDFRKQYLEWEY